MREWVDVLTHPLAVATLLGVGGTLCGWRGRLRLARWLFVGAAMVVYLGASPLVGNALIGPLERTYGPIDEGAAVPAVDCIVVLGSGYAPRAGISVTAALDETGLVRVVEGIRLMRQLRVGKLVLSGGAPPGHGRPASGYAELARGLGLPDSSLVVLDQPQNTSAEAHAVRDLLGDAPFIMVTSAAHMPRAMLLMRRVGAHPIPAPTGQLHEDSPYPWNRLLPTSGGLREVEVALHEYLGLAALAAGID